MGGGQEKIQEKGVNVLKMELFQKGVDREIIDKVLGENRVDEEKLAREALEKS